MATRYTDQKKRELVDFVRAYDEEHGSGGQAAAKKKFGINPISIKKWCVEADIADQQEVKATPKVKKVARPKVTMKKAAAKVRKAPAQSGPEAEPPKPKGSVSLKPGRGSK